jgi:hypothetical protein
LMAKTRTVTIITVWVTFGGHPALRTVLHQHYFTGVACHAD